MKTVYNKRDLCPRLVSYLEKWSGGTLTKVRLLVPNEEYPAPGWWRWKLEGITDVSYSNNTGNKLSTLFSALRLPLQSFYKDSLLRVCKEIGSNDLILDVSNEDSLFSQEVPEDFLVWESRPPCEFRAKEAGLIKIPYVSLLPPKRNPVGRPRK